MKHTTIDASILPKAWLTWSTTKGNFYVDCEINEKSNIRPDVDFSWRNRNTYILVTSGSKPIWAYAKYHEDIQMLELATATFDTRRTAESHEWKYAGNRYFINKEKKVFDENGNQYDGLFTLYESHYAYNFKNFLDMYIRLSASENLMKEFHKLIGGTTFTNSTGRVYNAKYIYSIREWYIRKQKVNNKGKAHKLAEALTAIPLSDSSDFAIKYPSISYKEKYWTNSIDGIIYFERVNDEWSVLRMFDRRGCDKEEVREHERMYLHDNGTNRIVTPSKNGWVPAKQFNDWIYYQFVNKDEAMEKCNRLKYIIPLFEDEKRIKNYLMTTLRFPEIEQLIKLGHGEFAKQVAGSNYPKAEMKHAFGGYYNEKEKNLLRKIGLTKHQFDRHMTSDNIYYRSYYDSSPALAKMREFFGSELSHIDNASFDRYYDAFKAMANRCGYRFENTIDRIDVDKSKFIKNMVRLGEKDESIYTLIIDTINMYFGLSTERRPEVNWYFDSRSDVTRIHDVIVDLKLVEDAERRARYNMEEAKRLQKEEEKRIKLDEKRKELEYEDDDFVIRLPINGNEIVREGMKQHICIGSYVSRHSTGSTNLFFLRKKSEPDVPFYAIEMFNEKVINQIHGFGNRWLGNNPEAIPTVIRWLRKNGIKCSDHILTCTATGYGSNNSHVRMPVVD